MYQNQKISFIACGLFALAFIVGCDSDEETVEGNGGLEEVCSPIQIACDPVTQETCEQGDESCQEISGGEGTCKQTIYCRDILVVGSPGGEGNRRAESR